MKFHLVINLERSDENTDMRQVCEHTLEMVKMADEAGFEVAWASEHHALEMTISPNPFQILTWWGENTKRIRLGCGVVNAAYWHPIRLAGEAALLDVISGGRLELGIGSGAYQREFDRMHPGLDQKDGYRYVQEMLPLVRRLWAGDVEHDGEFWQFPRSTSCPKPVQSTVPMWLAARSPVTFDYAVRNNCNILSWPIALAMEEARKYRSQLDAAVANHGLTWNGTFGMMRHTCVYCNDDDRISALASVCRVMGQFGNLMMKKGEVRNGFPEIVPLNELEGVSKIDPEMLEENLMFGSPSTVVKKLKQYQDIGVDAFLYYASMGLDMDQQKRSLDLFINEVMQEFA